MHRQLDGIHNNKQGHQQQHADDAAADGQQTGHQLGQGTGIQFFVRIIGINDGSFPSIHKEEGFLNDNDRAILKEDGIEESCSLELFNANNLTVTPAFIDMHVHTDNSPDGNHSPMFMCEQAVAKNLRAIAFCDHCETDKFYEHKYKNMVFHSNFECTKARSAFEGQLLVLLGIEIGQPLYNKELAEKIIDCTEDEIDALAAEMLLNTQAFIDLRTECNKTIEYCEKEISKNETV